MQGGLAADFGGDKLIQVDVGDTPAVGTTVVYLERTGLDLGAPDVTKLCRRIWPRIDGDDGTQIAIQVGAQMFTDEPVKWAPAVTFTLGTDRKIDCSVQGRYLAVKAYTSENASFRMPGFDMEIAGQWRKVLMAISRSRFRSAVMRTLSATCPRNCTAYRRNCWRWDADAGGMIDFRTNGVNKFGRNTDVDQVEETIWDGGGTVQYTPGSANWSTTADITHVVSNNTGD